MIFTAVFSFLALILCVSQTNAQIIAYPPTSWLTFRGIHISGDLKDVAESDDSYLKHLPGLTLVGDFAPVWLIFESTLNTDSPSSLFFSVEASADTPNLIQGIEIWNYTTKHFDGVDLRFVSFPVDGTTTIDLTANINDYVESGTGNVRARVGWTRGGILLLYPWTTCLDQIVWTTGD